MQRQAQAWGAARLQDALGILVDTDLALRSGGQTAPGMAVIERSMIRMAQLLRRR
jgi:DNA polymerase-3 subunit delta